MDFTNILYVDSSRDTFVPVLIPCSRLVNIAVGVFMVLGGISNFFTGTWSSFILGAYAVVFGLGRSLPHPELTTSIGGANIILVVGGLEFLPNVPDYAYRYASFLFSFLGRGVFYIFIGSILLHDHVLRIIDGSLIAFIGLAYIALEFIPSIEPPSNMRESDQGWGAEQI
ncbi:unnamed protein product [Penicillium nalgiovense]|nr:unnamed protein product [Penicillium nalgiovense]